MNCDDVLEVLDNERPDRIEAGRRRLITAHMAVCDACARAWNLQTALAAMPDMAMPAGLATQCRVLVAAGPGPVPTARVARPLRLIGAVAAMAAAAAALTLVLRPDPVTPGQVPESAQAEAAPAVADEVPPGSITQPIRAIASETAPAPQFTVRLVPREHRPAGLSDAFPRYSSEVERANSIYPSREQSMQALQSALAEGLRKVPGLVLVDADPAEVSASRKHFRLQIGYLSMLERDGRPMPVDSRYVDVALSAEEIESGGKAVHGRGPLARVDLQANCFSDAATDPPCNDVPGVAAAMIQALIRDVFPPPTSLTGPLQARFRDSSVDTTQRLDALEELYTLQLRMKDASLVRDPDMVRAAIALAATGDATLRARIWRSLRGAGNVELIQPLLASLVEEAADVRLAAVEILSADFLSDPRVRAALEATSTGDQRPLVRAVAQRALSGEGAWRQYVISSLKDSGRPAPERVEALVHHLYPPGPTIRTTSTIDGYFEIMEELLDEESVRALAAAIPDSNGLGRGANNLLGNFGSRFRTHPAIPGMMLRVLQEDPRWLMRAVAAEHLGRFHFSEPWVREAFRKALDSDPEPRVHEVIRTWTDKAP